MFRLIDHKVPFGVMCNGMVPGIRPWTIFQNLRAPDLCNTISVFFRGGTL